MEEVRMTRPCPEAVSAGRHACTDRMVPRRLVPSTCSMSESVMSASRASGKIPALAHSTSMPPSRSAAAAAIRWQSSRLPTSARTCQARPPPADSSATVALAASASLPTIRTRAPAPANTRAMPLPMPRVAPVTTAALPAMDVNMLPSLLDAPGPTAAGPLAEPAEVGLGKLAAVKGVPGSQFLRDVHARVRADPRDQQQPPEQDERPDLRLVRGGQVEHPAVAVQPGLDQVGHVRLMFEEADRGANVVEVPAEPGVIEVDDAHPAVVDEQVR